MITLEKPVIIEPIKIAHEIKINPVEIKKPLKIKLKEYMKGKTKNASFKLYK